jgi:2'-5' RNA ligase
VIRAFVGVSLDAAVIGEIARASARLQREISGIRWVAPANLHVTLKFLGSIDEAKVEPIGTALTEQLRLFSPFTIGAKGLGVFPGSSRPRVLWVGLTCDRLIPLASTVEAALQPLGFAPDSRKFTPHLTIGRWREGGPAPKSLAQRLEEWKDREFGVSRVRSVSLVRSITKPEGASYHPLMTVLLESDNQAR